MPTRLSSRSRAAGLETIWGEEAAERMLIESGFRSVTNQRLDHDPQNTYYVVRK